MLWKRPAPSERLTPQGDEAFLAALSMRVPASRHAVALEVRRAIASFAGVDVARVSADATFDDLDIGTADSIDELDLVLRLEHAVGRELSERERAQIPSPDLTGRLSVGTLVRAVCEVVPVDPNSSPGA